MFEETLVPNPPDGFETLLTIRHDAIFNVQFIPGCDMSCIVAIISYVLQIEARCHLQVQRV